MTNSSNSAYSVMLMGVIPQHCLILDPDWSQAVDLIRYNGSYDSSAAEIQITGLR